MNYQLLYDYNHSTDNNIWKAIRLYADTSLDGDVPFALNVLR